MALTEAHPPSPLPSGDAPYLTPATLVHERAVQCDPYSLPVWLDYLSHLTRAVPVTPIPKLFCVYERALAALPGSYKLWLAYTTLFRDYAAKRNPNHPSRRAAVEAHERAAHALRLSPILWARFVTLLLHERRLTRARRAVSDALRALPITQHHHVWTAVTDAYPLAAAPRLAVTLLQRYAAIDSRAALDPLVNTLVASTRVDNALTLLAGAMAAATAPDARSELLLRLVRLAARHATRVYAVDVPVLVHTELAQGSPVAVGELYATLAQFHARRAEFAAARAVLEHAVTTTSVVREFAVAFDAYSKLEESLVDALATAMQSDPTGDDDADLQLQLARLEYLVDRRPMLLSDVRLRQNVHNVHEWHKRVRMLRSAGDAAAVVDAYAKALRAVDGKRATDGRKHTLWLAFARYYEGAGELESSRKVLEAAVRDPETFAGPDEVSAVWCEYAEMELRCGSTEKAQAVLQRAVDGGSANMPGDAVKHGEGNRRGIAMAVRKSRRVWSFLLDVLQSGDDVDAVVQAHSRMLDLRITRSSSILSGAAYLEGRRLFERAFRLCDRGAAALSWPEALQVWVVYLTRFVDRFGARKIERARDLFEEAIASAPEVRERGRRFPYPLVKVLYLMYAEMEERHGVGRRALAVLGRAVAAVRVEDRTELYRLYVVKTATMYGVAKTRGVYVEALRNLPDVGSVAEFAMRFSGMEMRLGEVDRARAIFRECCAVMDTRGMGKKFWKAWEELETEFGDEDSVREMLRRRRRVQLDFQNVALGPRDGGYEGITNMVKDGEEGGGKVDDGANDGATERLSGQVEREAAQAEVGGAEGSVEERASDEGGKGDETGVSEGGGEIDEQEKKQSHGQYDNNEPEVEEKGDAGGDAAGANVGDAAVANSVLHVADDGEAEPKSNETIGDDDDAQPEANENDGDAGEAVGASSLVHVGDDVEAGNKEQQKGLPTALQRLMVAAYASAGKRRRESESVEARIDDAEVNTEDNTTSAKQSKRQKVLTGP